MICQGKGILKLECQFIIKRLRIKVVSMHCYLPSQLKIGKPPPRDEYPEYDIKQSDGDALRKQSTPSLPSLPGPLWPRVVASDRVLSMGQIELLNN